MRRTLSETTFSEGSPSVDAENGILGGAKLRGMESKNRRRYTDKANRESIPLYDGRKVYIDHPKRSESGEDRSFDRWVGVIRNPRAESDGAYGNIVLRKESPYFKGIIEAAQRFPNSIGFSHVADGDSQIDAHGVEIVESITEVFSVDLVTDPATTNGIFESVKNTGKKKLTLRQVAEALPESNPFRSRLIEGMDAGMFDGSQPVGETDAGGETDLLKLVSQVFQKALETVAQMAGSKAMADANANQQANQNNAANAGNQQQPNAAKTNKPADPNAAAGGAQNPLDPQKRIESLEKRLALSDAKNLLNESGIEPTEIRVATLASVPEDARTKLLESWPKKDAPKLTESTDSFWPSTSPAKESSGSTEKYADADYEKNFWESTKAKSAK